MSSTETKPGRLMSFTVHRSELLAELSAALGTVDQKSTVPILTSVLLEARENQKLLITSTDLVGSLRTFCSAAVRVPGSCAVPARKLYDYVRLLPDGDIQLWQLENGWVQVRSGRSNTRMVGMGREKFPTLPLFPGTSATRISAKLLKLLIHRTTFAISADESRYTLNGALLEIKPGSVRMVATDGHRLACLDAQDNTVAVKTEIRALVPRKALITLSSLLNTGEGDEASFAQDDSTLFFGIGQRLFTSQRLSGQFPNYDAVMPRDLARSVEMPAQDMLRALQRVSQFADDRSRSVRLRLEADVLRISSMHESCGESEDTIAVSYAEDPLNLRFNAEYLLDFAKVAGTGNVRLHFKGPDQAGEFRPVEPDATHTYRYVVMPMRS